MIILKDILYKISLLATSGDMEVSISEIVFDSRKVTEGSLFVATRGTHVDGHDFIDMAIEKGAQAVVCEELPQVLKSDITYIQVADAAKALGILGANFYGNPSAKLKLVAVTGTNGKTTIATLLYQLFGAMGYTSGLLSTVQNEIAGKVIPATHTTPDAIQLNALLAQMVKAGCTHCFMEASSHAIVQQRIAGLQFAGAIFSNISHDHLDYHKTFDEYIKAKKMLFDQLPSTAFALTNVDDKRGMVMLQNTKAAKHTYGLKGLADFKGKILSNTLQGLELDINNRQVWFKLIGDFNAYNLLAVLGTAVLLEESEEEVLMQLSSLAGAKGRFEQIQTANKITAIIDYAHTPDALENVLKTIQGVRAGNEKVITVVGCGGNRDTTKRPVMAEIAAKLSDQVILTSDNPRDEDPAMIIQEMQQGIPISQMRKALSIVDRREAIKTACVMAAPGDIILIAGKGHEDYQEIKGVKHHFDDKEVASEFLKMIHS